MTASPRPFVVALCSAALAAGLTASARQAAPPLDQLEVPTGFQVASFAENVENARQMALGPQGTVFVGTRTAGKVHAVVDSDGDHSADRVVLIASDLDQPNGVAMRNGALYVATASRILRFDDIESHLDAPPTPVTVREDLPNPNRGHTWKYIAFGPDDKLYLSVGAPCNVCESPALVSAILRMEPDGSGLEMFAEGIRNSVGFDWHPVTDELWFTENGRDGMGDDVPDDELNVAWQAGMHFGFPYCHQGDVQDPQFGDQRACSTTEPPVLNLGPHVAAVGMTFYTGSMFPAGYRNAAIIALHGSWNRTTPSGYRVMVARVDGRRVTGFEPLVDNFLPTGSGATGRGAGRAAMGRPADVLQMPDGSILVSDDSGHRIIRVSYQERAEITINDTGVQAENLTSSRDGSTVQEEIIALSRQKWLWMAERRMDELSDLFHEDAVFVHMGGSMGRTQELATIKSGGIQYKHADIQEISAVVVDATAVVLSRLRLTAVVGGNEVVNPFAVTEVYVRQGTSWKLVSLAFTRLPG